MFFTKVSLGGSATLFLNSWEMLPENAGARNKEVPAEMKEFRVWDADKIQGKTHFRPELNWILRLQFPHSAWTWIAS